MRKYILTSALFLCPLISLGQKPSINSVSPPAVQPSTVTAITINGSGFQRGATILVSGTHTPATYVSSTQLKADIAVGADEPWLQVRNPSYTDSASFGVPIARSNVASVGSNLPYGVAQDFVGLSSPHAWYSFGVDGTVNGVNLPLRQLIRNLQTSNADMFIRIGDGDTDQITGTDPTLRTSLQELAQDVKVTYAFGINMAANSPTIVAQQTAFYASIPGLKYWELGNESEFYGGHGVRPYDYSITDWINDFNNLSEVAQKADRSITFMASSWGQIFSAIIPAGKHWGHWGNTYPTTAPYLTLENAESNELGVFSLHMYSAYSPVSGDYLLTPAAIWAAPEVAPIVAQAHSMGQKFRIGEMNSEDGGGQVGLSDTFQSALWAIDQMFDLANVGVDGVNWSAFGCSPDVAFTFNNGPWNGNTQTTPYQASVKPLYYGMLFFAQATANTRALTRVELTTSANVKAWAVTADDGSLRVILIDKDTNFKGTVAVKAEGYSGTARLDTLTAPSYTSKSGLSLDGQTFDGTVNGVLAGRKTQNTITESEGYYDVTFSGVGAAMLTLTPQ